MESYSSYFFFLFRLDCRLLSWAETRGLESMKKKANDAMKRTSQQQQKKKRNKLAVCIGARNVIFFIITSDVGL